MWLPFNKRQPSGQSLLHKCVVRLLRLLPRNQIIRRTVHEERRRPIVPLHNLRLRTHGDNFVEAWLRQRFPVSDVGTHGFVLAEKTAGDDR